MNRPAQPSQPSQPASTPGTSGAAAAGIPAVASALYRQVVLVDRQVHAHKRVEPVRDWRIAGGMNAVFVTGIEFAPAAREFPIAFVPIGRSEQGGMLVSPVVLLGLRENENLIVTAEGRWDARFLPAFLRRYPFAYVRTDVDDYKLAVDSAWAGFNDSSGEALLNEAGEPSEYLSALMKFLDAFEQESARTRKMCERLVELDLLRSGEINGQLQDGTPVKAEGFFMVDEDKLRQLPDSVVLELHRNGVLGLIHAHLVSMGQVDTLAQRLADRS